MRFSVIIPTYKRHLDLARVMESLYNQNKIPEEIIIIIGPGDKQSILISDEWKTKLPELKIINSTKASVVHALNLGMKVSKEEIICLLDDDVWLPPDWALKIEKTFLNNYNLGAFGGRDHLQIGDSPALSNPEMVKKIGKFNWDGTLIGNHHCGVVHSPISVDVLKGCNLAFRRIAFKKMEIDSILESKGAETCWEIDICLQIKQAGFQLIYANENYILHYASQRLSFDERNDIFSEAWSMRIFNQAYIMAKYRPFQEIVLFSLRLLLIGTHNTPGIVWSFLLLPKHGIKIFTIPWNNLRYHFRGLKKGYYVRKRLKF